jgi:hypothetical protein
LSRNKKALGPGFRRDDEVGADVMTEIETVPVTPAHLPRFLLQSQLK